MIRPAIIRVDQTVGKTYLTGMIANTRLSSKGQIVIPKDIRDALRLKPGERLSVTRHGRRIILEVANPPADKISYTEFRLRVPAYTGPPVAVEDMTASIGKLFEDWQPDR